ncbi:MAG: hypothetical protein QG635_1907 [Bacteroidota bacterium]|nr:hypothetical protein [Bacteroidota bacterium]
MKIDNVTLKEMIIHSHTISAFFVLQANRYSTTLSN